MFCTHSSAALVLPYTFAGLVLASSQKVLYRRKQMIRRYMRKLNAPRHKPEPHFREFHIYMMSQIWLFFTQFDARETCCVNHVIRLYEIEIFKKIVNRFERELLTVCTRQLNTPMMNTKYDIMGVFDACGPIQPQKTRTPRY